MPQLDSSRNDSQRHQAHIHTRHTQIPPPAKSAPLRKPSHTYMQSGMYVCMYSIVTCAHLPPHLPTFLLTPPSTHPPIYPIPIHPIHPIPIIPSHPFPIHITNPNAISNARKKNTHIYIQRASTPLPAITHHAFRVCPNVRRVRGYAKDVVARERTDGRFRFRL